MSAKTPRDRRQDTVLAHAGRDPARQSGFVNPPVYRGSTVLFPTVAALDESRAHRFDDIFYGRYGTPTTRAFEEAVAMLEGGTRSVAVSSGLAAITVALTAFVSAGDHVLVSDSVYAPTRAFCDKALGRFGVETTYYDPLVGDGIATLMRPETKVVFTESPGSHTFEVQDVPAIAKAAHAHGAVVLLDNTWATPLFFKPFQHGVDVSIQSATKYLVGHSDSMLGVVTVAEDETFRAIKSAATLFGNCPGPEDVWLGLRGLRTLSARLARHQETARTLCDWLQGRPEVARVMYPPLADDPGHALWRRDFTGASGLFGLVLDRDYSKAAVAAFLDGLELFGLGASWGGYESLALPFDPRAARTATKWTASSPTIRIHAGLEDVRDLIDDLERGFGRLGRTH